MKRYLTLIAALSALVLPLSAPAQAWPERTVKFVVPYPAGGNADLVARIVGQALHAKLGQPFIVENRAGAGGMIGGGSVVNSDPDGHTLLFSANGPILFAPELVAQPAYKWRTGFEPVTTVSLTPLVLLVTPKAPPKDFKAFVEYARKEGDKLTYGSGGLGTINHLFSEYLQAQLKLKWTTTHYKGTAPMMNDLIAGHIPFAIDQVSAATPFVKSGRVRALAITGEKRSGLLPEVPTLVELGHKDLVGYTFTAVMAPKGTPKDVVAKIQAAIDDVLKDQVVVKKIEDLGAEVGTMKPDAFRAFLEREEATWTPLVRKIGK